MRARRTQRRRTLPEGFSRSVNAEQMSLGVAEPDSVAFQQRLIYGKGAGMMADEPAKDEERVVYVQRSGNGMAVASLVLGIIGVVFGLVPLTGFIAVICGLLATVFGWVGRKNAKKDPQVGRKTMATWGLVLGVIALALGIWGIVIVGDAINDLEQELEDL